MKDSEYYVVNEGNLLVLRQKRFKKELEKGLEHPHDVMAYARTQKEMDGMIKTITKD